MRKIISFILILASFSLSAQDWKAKSSTISFKIKMLGVTAEGNFKGLSTDFTFNEGIPTSLSAAVKTATLDTDNSLRDTHLKEKEEFFQVAKYPTLKMKSVSLSPKGKAYEGVFALTIKNVTKNVTIPFDFIENGNTAKLKSTFKIDRTKWNFGGDTFGMSDDVTVYIDINLSK